MAQKKVDLRKIREVLRLHYEQNYSNREVGGVLNISHTTVGKLSRAVRDVRYTWPLPDEVVDTMLERICYLHMTHSACD